MITNVIPNSHDADDRALLDDVHDVGRRREMRSRYPQRDAENQKSCESSKLACLQRASRSNACQLARSDVDCASDRHAAPTAQASRFFLRGFDAGELARDRAVAHHENTIRKPDNLRQLDDIIRIPIPDSRAC
jgi:hypothetical protein